MNLAEIARQQFAAAGAVTETYQPPSGAAVEVQVLYERGVVHEVPGRQARVTDRRTRAHLLVSEVGRPVRSATLTDGGETRTIDGIESDDGDVVVVWVR